MSDQPTPSERIGEEYLAGHRLMVAKRREAEQHAAKARDGFAAFRAWCEALHEAHGLAVDGSEGVDENGAIIRAEPA